MISVYPLSRKVRVTAAASRMCLWGADVATFLGRGYGDKPQAMLDRIAPAGTPEEVAERLQEYVDAGVRHFIISPAASEDTFEVIKLAAEEVLPRLHLPGQSP